MSVQVKLRRDTAANNATFTGAQGELVMDTTNNILRLQDGVTQAGWPIATATRTAVSDAAYSALVTDRLIAYTAITVARAVALPAASAMPTGAELTVVDESGSVTTTNTITLNRAGSDTIDGQTSQVIAQPYGSITLESNGSNAWAVIGSLPNTQTYAGNLTTATAVSATTTPTTGGVTLTNQILALGSRWRIRAFGNIVAANSASARTFVVGMYFGGTLVGSVTSGTVLASNAVTSSWEFEGFIAGLTTTSVYTAAKFYNHVVTNITAAELNPLLTTANATTTGLSAGAQTIDFRVNNGTNAVDAINVYDVTIERIK